MHKKVYIEGNGSLILSCDLGIISICYSDNDQKSAILGAILIFF